MYKKERREGVILMVQVSLLRFGDGCGSQLAEWGVYRLNAGLAVQFVIKFSPNHIAKSIILLAYFFVQFQFFFNRVSEPSIIKPLFEESYAFVKHQSLVTALG